MGNPVYFKNEKENYKTILESGLSDGSFFLERINQGDDYIYCIFSSQNHYDYIFWKQNVNGDIGLFLQIDKRSNVLHYIKGSLTKIGKMMCDCSINNIPLVEYLNTTQLNQN
jgi:hypothetical protein